MKKRPVLLLELVISLTLFGAIMGILFSSYRELSLTKSILQREKEKILSRERLQLRLSQIFSNLKSLKWEEGKSCLLSYDNGVDPEPKFRGVLQGMLYIDKKGSLNLVTWSEEGTSRQELLFEQAGFFSFQFFDGQKGSWSSDYPEQKPLMMKMTLNTIKLPFFL